MQGCSTPNGSHHLHAGTLAVRPLHIHDLVALANAQVDRLLDQLVQFAHGQQCGVAHAQARLHQIAQFQQPHAQAVAAGLRAVDKTSDGQIVEDAVGRGWVQTGLFADFLE